MSTESPDFETTDVVEAHGYREALRDAGVEYEQETVFRIRITDEPDNDDSEPSEDTEGRARITNIDASPDAKAVVEAIATHPRAWVNSRDIDPDIQRSVSQIMAELYRGDVLVRRGKTRDHCHWEYRLKDAYRREAGLMEAEDE